MEISTEHLLGIGSVAFLVTASLWPLFTKTPKVKTPSAPVADAKIEAPSEKAQPREFNDSEWNSRLFKGLGKTRNSLWTSLNKLFGKSTSSIDPVILEEVEAGLYAADLGTNITQSLMNALKSSSSEEVKEMDEIKIFLSNFLKEQVSDIQQKILPLEIDKSIEQSTQEKKYPKVIMIVGVNGVGKTTSIGKLATKLKLQGYSVVVGACDTFRAAAVDQLEVWCQRAQVEMVRANPQNEKSDPSGVAYQTLEKAIGLNADYCILDTAGRLHNNKNLMEELKKGKRVLQKLIPHAPDHIYLVIDAITGQNALRQAKEFHEALNLTGIIYTKCDGSSKGGSALQVIKELQVPISFIGVGEGVEDLGVFQLDAYINALLT